jgi:bifunctional UDP-N-acetylglucosamine pyrophosphorylase / glucosamine-1-phosphate N-acetyltransferase
MVVKEGGSRRRWKSGPDGGSFRQNFREFGEAVEVSYRAIVLAAGKGVRMRSELPKVLHKVCGLTLVERVLRAVAGAGITEITCVIGNGAELVEEELSRLKTTPRFSDVKISTALQTEQRGTGHAASTGFQSFSPGKERILILPGDTPLIDEHTIKSILEGDRANGFPEVLAVSLVPPSSHGYGRIVRDAAGKFQKIVEHKDCNEEELKIREVNSSIYCGGQEFLRHAVSQLTPQNAQKELYITDVVGIGMKAGKRVEAFLFPDHTRLGGANNRAELTALELLRREEIARSLMENGATLESPATTFVDEDVQVGSDVFIGSGTRLRAETKLENGVVIDGDTIIDHSTIGAKTHVKLGCSIETSQVGDGCHIGPFAHLRPGSVLKNNVHIGNFVETKQTEMGEGAKANHLSYLGDATIGAKVNIGAGTITANYDGYNKSKTIIGDGASTGSNSTLVAPVEVGPGAYIGAGSVISKPVPADALALTRAELKLVDAWSKRRREKYGK